MKCDVVCLPFCSNHSLHQHLVTEDLTRGRQWTMYRKALVKGLTQLTLPHLLLRWQTRWRELQGPHHNCEKNLRTEAPVKEAGQRDYGIKNSFRIVESLYCTILQL